MSKFIPKKVSRFGSRSMLKARKHSPTILVVAGVVGFGATVIAAAKATPKAQKVVEEHKTQRANIGEVPKKDEVSKEVRKDVQIQVIELYYNTGLELSKVYGPTIVLGTLSAASILYGHRILNARHAATMAAYSGLMDQFNAYRGRVRKTLGEQAERDIYNGAHGEYVEDPDHKGEYKLQPVFADGELSNDSRFVWFNDKNPYFKLDPAINLMHLNGTMAHMNQLLQVRGHLFLNEVKDALGMPRTADGQVLGWVLGGEHNSDGFVDFGHLNNDDPDTIAFRNGERADVRLVFNVDGMVHDLI